MDHPQITILLALYKRPQYTLRFLTYLASFNCPYPIFLADGSFDKEEHLKIISQFESKLKLIHRIFKRDDCIQDYYQKIVTSLEEIKTSYVFFADNDDFVNFEHFEHSISFLNKNPDYVMHSGQTAYFNINILNNHSLEYCAFHSMPELNDNIHYLSLKRIEENLKNYTPNFYSVVRTDVILKAYKKQADSSLSDIFLSELLTSNYVLLFGKQKITNHIYYLRQLNTVDSAARQADMNNTGLIGRFLAPNWSADFYKYINGLKAEISGYDEKYTTEQLVQYYFQYANNNLIKKSNLFLRLCSILKSKKFPFYKLFYRLESSIFLAKYILNTDYKYLTQTKNFIREYGTSN